jgi:autotransporter adhesin
MNTIYKLVWNPNTRSFVAASELAKGRTKKASSVARIAAAVALGLSFGAHAFTTQDANVPGSSCTTASGQAGTTDAAGVCTVSSPGGMSTESIGTLAAGDYAAGGGSATGGDGVAIGSVANTTGQAATAIGSNTKASGNGAIAIGGSTSTGLGAQALQHESIAFGEASVSNAQGSIAIGTTTSVTGTNSVALGANANATASNSVALGSTSVANRASTVSVGSATSLRQIVNVGAGTQANDAVNVSQLSPVVSALGGGASINTTTGAVTGPTYTLANGGTTNTVGGALAGLDGALTTANSNISQNATDITSLTAQINSGSVGLVQQASSGAALTVGANTDGSSVNFTGTAGARTLTGVANGAISATSRDAVNGSQLHSVSNTLVTALGGGAALNPDGSIFLPSYQVGGTTVTSVSDAIHNIDGRVTQNSSDISDLADQIDSGTVGLVKQSTAGANLTIGAGTDGAAVDFTGTAGARTLTGVAAGSVSATSSDAVNGSQLRGVSDSVASAIGGGATVNADGSVSMPSYSVGGTTVHSVGGAITNVDHRVTQNSSDITNLTDQVSNGSVGLVQQAAPGANLTVGAATGGALVDFTGTDGMRRLTGVANGIGDDDAVTMSQLKAAGLYDPSGDPMTVISYDDHSLASVTLGGTNGTVINNLAPGLIAAGSMQAVNGSQLFDMQQTFQSKFDSLNNQVGDLNDRVGTIEQGIADGTIGGPGNGGGDPVYGPGSGSGDNSLVVGDNADASGSDSVAVGNGSEASGDKSTATGTGAVASGNNSTATGAGAVASGSGSTAVGAGATASGENATALGSNANASGNNSVALGAGSVADRDNTVSVGSEGNERQITNVAAGTQRTDAANWGQVQDAVNGVQDWANQKFHQVDKRINRMGAMSAAYGQMAFSAQGLETKHRLGVGVGTQGGQSAIAVGYSRQLKPNMNLSFGGSASAGDVSMGAGLSVGW